MLGPNTRVPQRVRTTRPTSAVRQVANLRRWRFSSIAEYKLRRQTLVGTRMRQIWLPKIVDQLRDLLRTRLPGLQHT